jgi:hypothetical protein
MTLGIFNSGLSGDGGSFSNTSRLGCDDGHRLQRKIKLPRSSSPEPVPGASGGGQMPVLRLDKDLQIGLKAFLFL